MLKRTFSSFNPADVACDTTSNPDQSEESDQISETRFDKSELVQNGSKRKRSQSFSLFLSPLNHHPETMKIFRDFEDIMAEEQRKRKVWKLVLTGGPCGGKTTGQTRLATFFENLGWKVYRVPETANILLSGGVNFAELSDEAAERFQENLLKTMIQIENSFFDLANSTERNCLVICDRGAMDASAFISRDQWENILARNGLDEVEVRDNRYSQVIHMVSAAKGAEQFYTIEHHASRSEGLEQARDRDTAAASAWVGHPYVDIVDNLSDFESKIRSLISKVAWSIGIDIGDRLTTGARKLKFVVNGPLPSEKAFPEGFRDFEVCHHYLQTSSRMMQSRLRKRGRKGKWTYTHTIRKQVSGQVIEVKTPLTHRDYSNLISQEDSNHFLVYKTRRCFLYRNQYFQLDIYKDPCHDRCRGLMLLETYTTLPIEMLKQRLPEFLNIGSETTGDPAFSMFNLSLKEEWVNNKKFCHRLSDDEKEGLGSIELTQQAKDRLDANKSRQSSPTGEWCILH
jgi:hypothetical protein